MRAGSSPRIRLAMAVVSPVSRVRRPRIELTEALLERRTQSANPGPRVDLPRIGRGLGRREGNALGISYPGIAGPPGTPPPAPETGAGLRNRPAQFLRYCRMIVRYGEQAVAPQ